MNIATVSFKGLSVPCAALLALAFVSQANAKAEEYVKAYTVNGPATVHVKVDDSSVHVITSDTNQVEFRVSAEGFSAINIGGKLHVDSQQNGNDVELTVRIAPRVTIGFSNRRLSTEVRMPKNADLQVETSDGHVELADLKGNITVHTSDGRITASQLSGTIDLRSSDGDITADALSGDFKVHSGDGKVSATQLDGKCNVSTGDGAIHLAGRFDSLDVKTGDGSVTVRAEPGSKMSSMWSVSSSDGGIILDVPKDIQANLDASTSDGHISLGLPVSVAGDLGKKTVHGTINGGGPTLLLHTSDGSIHLNGI